MAIKKSELYSSIWASCDELRGGMDASQYKDYVLVFLFIKYISDKFAHTPYPEITVPKGATFQDMVALKGNPEIGDLINKRIIAPLAKANHLDSMPDFNDSTKLGSGKEKVERLTNLIAIFESPALDFSKNKAEGDDILGDAYEYLMNHFAVDSGKSKGQFYTPAEVSRVIAKIIGISKTKTSSNTTVYDPTCGSGSLLLKVAAEATTSVTLNGQEKDSATSALARMNMILHGYSTAEIKQGNTLTTPYFKNGQALKQFDYVVANPPFSDKRWSNGLTPDKDPFERFKTFGIPPAKQGDYAYLLHIIRSLKSTGQGACILPHGVLFRGNTEADIRRSLIKHGYIKGIIGLPANLFYGTGIPACIIVIDKKEATSRKGIFMIDASRDFIKDGAKNRLRERDLHKIVDVFNRFDNSNPKYARMVPYSEIEENDFNLNLPRYIDSSIEEIQQNIDAHLQGGIPVADIDSEKLNAYWSVCPELKSTLFQPLNTRPNYYTLKVEKNAIRNLIRQSEPFSNFIENTQGYFKTWRTQALAVLKNLSHGFSPKALILEQADGLLLHYQNKPLIDAYAIYQILMNYWQDTMQDDCYLIADDGWQAKPYRVIEIKKGKNNQPDKEIDKGWACDLIAKELLVSRYFEKQQNKINQLQETLDVAVAQRNELEEEHNTDDGIFADFDKINAKNIKDRLKEIAHQKDAEDEKVILDQWIELFSQEKPLKDKIKEAEATLDKQVYEYYAKLTEEEIKTLVVEDKWLNTLEEQVENEINQIVQTLTNEIKTLAERYETPLFKLNQQVKHFEECVANHLEKMGFVWH